MEAPILETQRLIMRPFSHTDVSEFVEELTSQCDIMANLSEECAAPSEQERCAILYIEDYSSSWQTHHYGGWAVCARTSEIADPGKLLGFCGFAPGLLEGAGAELAFAYGRSYWGKGIGTEAASACIRWFFDVGGHDRCYVSHHSWNEASRKIIEAIGFVYYRDEDLWGSVEKGDGLLPTYLLDRESYLNHGQPAQSLSQP